MVCGVMWREVTLSNVMFDKVLENMQHNIFNMLWDNYQIIKSYKSMIYYGLELRQ